MGRRRLVAGRVVLNLGQELLTWMIGPTLVNAEGL